MAGFVREPATLGLKLALALLTALVLGACSSRPVNVRGETPLVRLDSLSRLETSLVAGVSIRNVNDSPLELDRLELELMLDAQAVRGGGSLTFTLVIASRGREVVEFRFNNDEQRFPALDQISAGDRASLPWSLILYEGAAAKRRKLAEASGFLHSVPGQPDRFR